MAEKIVLCPAAKKTKQRLQKGAMSALQKADKIKKALKWKKNPKQQKIVTQISVWIHQ